MRLQAGIAVSLLICWQARPAAAIPPPPLTPQTLATVQRFIAATRENDFAGLRHLFSNSAVIQNGDKKEINLLEWSKTERAELSILKRDVEVLNVIGYGIGTSFADGVDVVILERLRACNPAVIECFPAYRYERITISEGQIERLERSQSYWTMLSPTGGRLD